MGSKYKWDINPFQDFLILSSLYGADISDEKLINEIGDTFLLILENTLDNENDAVYLDFEIRNDNDYIKIVGKNAPTALWLSGIMPKGDVDKFLKQNIFVINNKKYIFNKKTFELSNIIIDE